MSKRLRASIKSNRMNWPPLLVAQAARLSTYDHLARYKRKFCSYYPISLSLVSLESLFIVQITQPRYK